MGTDSSKELRKNIGDNVNTDQKTLPESKNKDSEPIMIHRAKMPIHHAGHDKGATDTASENAWKAKVGGDPLFDAFPDGIVTHPGVSARPVAPEDKDAFLENLLAKPREQKSAAYIHIPYCETRCLYCMFYNKPYRNAEESKIFTDHLIREIDLWSDKAVMTGRPIRTVYFGGGTPTALEANDIARLLKAVREKLPLANDAEITYEGRLSNFGTDRMDACIEGGVNRFSLGVQTFDTKVRQAVGRRSDKDELISQLQKLMSYDEAAVVIDLIYGFPYQTMETWEEDLRIARELNLDGVDCYQLRVFPGSPLHKYIANGKLPAGPDHRTMAEMFRRSVEIMEDAQWDRISITHWANNPRERNLYNYFAKTRTDVLSFGPGAGGNIAGNAYMIERNVAEWMKQVAEGKKPVAMIMAPHKLWQLHKAVSEHMELNRLNPKALEKEFALPVTAIWAPILENWVEAGLMTQRGDFYLLTVAGQFWQTRLIQLLLNQIK